MDKDQDVNIETQNAPPSTTSAIAVAGCKLAVPRSTAKLLYLSDEYPGSVFAMCGIALTLNLLDGQVRMTSIPSGEPSTIFARMPVAKPRNVDEIPPPRYFPDYAGLTPAQKWIYLNWLRNIAEPIDIGYVFLYYYGLERHLLIGEFDLAFDEILSLRKHHNHSSFMFYSSSALYYACLFRKRRDRLEELYQSTEPYDFKNIDLLFACHLGLDLSAKNLMSAAKSVSGINRRYMKSHEELYESVLNDSLSARYGYPYFPLADRYEIPNLPKVQDVVFANISFPPELRTPELPNFFRYDPFIEEIRALFAEAHRRTGDLLKGKRTQKKPMAPTPPKTTGTQ